MPDRFTDALNFDNPYIARGIGGPLDTYEQDRVAYRANTDSLHITLDAYTKAEVDCMIEGLKSKIYKLLSDLNIDISEEDFYEALRL